MWHKRDQPFLRFPPENLPLVGWRDPFIFETGGDGKEWGMLLGSGLKGKGGAVLIYRSASLHEGTAPAAACSLYLIYSCPNYRACKCCCGAAVVADWLIQYDLDCMKTGLATGCSHESLRTHRVARQEGEASVRAPRGHGFSD